MMHILTIGLLRPAPARVAKIVDGRGEQYITAGGFEFAAHGCTHALLEPGIPGSAPGHTHGKRRRTLDGSDAPGAVRHLERRKAQPLHTGNRPELFAFGKEDGAFTRHLGDLVLECHLCDKSSD